MILIEWLQFILGVAFLLAGLGVFAVQVFGVFKFNYVLNRMHAAAMGDTLGIGISLVGLIILSGWNFASLKMALIIVFLWNASPVSSHLIARLEATTNPHLERCCELEEGVMEHLWDENQREIIYADQKKKNADKVDQNKVNHDKAIQHKAEEET
ncbi:monovalent cation/H(+) antiporter subunit G [Schaedlerella sp.]|uniref:cation:proton antiporter n=1 Tax=Schaedlerella sp. TaxID=2676057 RepID=UPI00261EE8FA|nr:monovalent cation/H(+) antiporter subunit G [uncultured Schaedlerella sp.]